MIIEIENLSKSYLGKDVLSIESMSITKGEKVVITGANGSGKSTLLKLALDLIRPDEGKVLLFGHNVRDDEKWKSRTSAYLNDSFLLDFLTVREYIHFLESSLTEGHINEVLGLLNFNTLDLNETIKNLSSGNKKKAGILGTLITKRELIIFDELSNFLDYKSKKGLIDYFKYLTDCTIVMVEHNIEFIQDFASRVVVLEAGSIIKDFKLKDTPPKYFENILSMLYKK